MKDREIRSVTPPIRAGFWCIVRAGLLAHVHRKRRLPARSVQWQVCRLLPFTVAGPHWIFTSFPFKKPHTAASPGSFNMYVFRQGSLYTKIERKCFFRKFSF